MASPVRLDLVVGVVSAFVLLAITAAAQGDGPLRRVGIRAGIAVAAGLIAAIVVLSLKTDIIPDEFETGGDVILILGITIFMLVGSIYRAWRG